MEAKGDDENIESLFQAPFNNEDFLEMYEKDKKIKIDFLGNRDFYYIIKGIAYDMNNQNITNYKESIKKRIERNFGGFEIVLDYEKVYKNFIELETYM